MQLLEKTSAVWNLEDISVLVTWHEIPPTAAGPFVLVPSTLEQLHIAIRYLSLEMFLLPKWLGTEPPYNALRLCSTIEDNIITKRYALGIRPAILHLMIGLQAASYRRIFPMTKSCLLRETAPNRWRQAGVWAQQGRLVGKSLHLLSASDCNPR